MLTISAQNGVQFIGSFINANSFTLSNFGYFYVTDLSNNSIAQIDTLGNVMQIIGGFGRDERTFDDPSDIALSNRKVYVTDKNNNRIQIFDSELNYITGIASKEGTSEVSFSYPSMIRISKLGDVFVYDSGNLRILKYNSAGELLSVIGDYDAGEYGIEDLIDFTVTEDEKLFAISGTRLIEYDTYGNGINKYDLEFETYSIESYKNFLIFATNSGIQIRNILAGFNNNEPEDKLFEFTETEIRDVCYLKGKLYLLTPKHIYFFNYSLE